MTRTVDVDTCASEPIRIPGAIQPFGALVVLDPRTLSCLQLSRNFSALTGVALQPGADFAATLGECGFIQDIRRWQASGPSTFLGRVRLNDRQFHVAGHIMAQGLILEFEPPPEAAPDFSLDGFYPRLRNFLEKIKTAPDLESIAEAAVRDMREITGFDRILLYSFDEDGHGTVLAEDGDGVLPSYRGLRFPASDIPAQARDLYRLNRVRLIADADYEPCPIEPETSPVDGAPLDLSFAGLRSVSPVHLEYMRNMGTASSMSVSIVVDGELWGLISGHSRNTWRVHPQTRAACDSLGQILSLQIEAYLRSELSAERLRLKQEETDLLALLAASDAPFEQALIDHSEKLLALAGAQGAAIVSHHGVKLTGLTPPTDFVAQLAHELFAQKEESFATDSLAAIWEDAASFAHLASGALGVGISQIRADYIFWFRPEVVRTINWSGDPTKTMTPGSGRLHPRQSFELWKEQVRLRSLPWSAVERDSAASFRSSIQTIVLRGAEERAALSDRLERANKELEAFSYSISHDLRAPFRHIVGFSELLADRAKNLDEKSQHYLRTISEAAFAAGRLVDDLLNFSQLGRASLRMQDVDMNSVVRAVRRSLEPDSTDPRIEWRVGQLPKAYGDTAMIAQIVQNLLQNAMKFSATRNPAIIAIDAEDMDDAVAYTVSDNGVGFEMEYSDKLFGVFQRLHRAEDFTGTGIGLALVKRIVVRHGGTVRADGAPGAGAKFTFTLPKRHKALVAGATNG